MFSTVRLLSSVMFLIGTLVASAQDLSTQVLHEVNLARTQPQRYAQLLAAKASGPRANSRDVADAIRFLQRQKPLSPLSYSAGLSQGARLHVNDLGPRGGRGHKGRGGSTPWSRMGKFGQWIGTAAENIYYGSRDARGVVCALIIDTGVPGKKHRQNIFGRSFSVAGVAHGPHAGFGMMCVMDFAGGFVERGSAIAGL